MTDPGMLLHRDLSGERAQALTAEITQFHRPPGASGYHAATDLVTRHLRDAGLANIEITTYPLDGATVIGDGAVPLAWEPHGAEVSVVHPVTSPVVDMRSVSSCLAWWSKPTPAGGMEAELVDVGTGESPEDFTSVDMRGKIALIGHTERPGGWSHAAKEAMQRGAVGILSDYLFYSFEPHRTRAGLPEAVQLLRLPNQLGQFDAWACSISFTVAERLRALLRDGPVTLHADIRCASFAGHGRNVLATIPGTDLGQESIFFISHTSAATCPCANCAAGPALMVEIARMLNALIGGGEISRPRRSIRFLFLIEGFGSRAYIHANRASLQHVKAAFCFDSVGHDQSKLKSALLYYRHPDAFPSFINDYFAEVMERAPNDGSWVFANDTDLGTVQFEQAPYTPWSDNHTWAAYGVPSPLIMSWPDLYFHTQFLTADNTDPAVFRRAGITTALAAYELASAGEPEALLIAYGVAGRAVLRLDATVNDVLRERYATPGDCSSPRELRRLERARKRVGYLAARDIAAVRSVLTLVPGAPSPRMLARVDACCDDIERQATRAVERLNESTTTSKEQPV